VFGPRKNYLVTVYEFLIGNWIYWTLTLVTTNNCVNVTKVRTPKISNYRIHIFFSVLSSRSLIEANNGGRSFSSVFPNCTQPQLPVYSQSHIATDGQSVSIVCLGVKPISWTFAQIFFSPPKLLFCLFEAPFLTRGRVCHVSVFVIEVYQFLKY
jgi:hypothetical protein